MRLYSNIGWSRIVCIKFRLKSMKCTKMGCGAVCFDEMNVWRLYQSNKWPFPLPKELQSIDVCELYIMIDSKRFFQIDKKKKERWSFPMLRTKHFQCFEQKLQVIESKIRRLNLFMQLPCIMRTNLNVKITTYFGDKSEMRKIWQVRRFSWWTGWQTYLPKHGKCLFSNI